VHEALQKGFKLAVWKPSVPSSEIDLSAGLVRKSNAVPVPPGAVLADTLPAGSMLAPPVASSVITDCRTFSDASKEEFGAPSHLALSLGSTDQAAIEKDYWDAYKAKREVGWGIILWSLFLGLWGFPAGLGLWIFYRLVRFAVKG
jgi:hypothetical protein